MVEDWQLKRLEGRLDSLEARLDRDCDRAREKKWRRAAWVSEFLFQVAQIAALAAVIDWFIWG